VRRAARRGERIGNEEGLHYGAKRPGPRRLMITSASPVSPHRKTPAGGRTLPCVPPALPPCAPSCVALHVICIETSRRGGTVGFAGQRPMARLDVGRNAKDAEETRSRCPQTRTREVPGIPKNLEKGRGGPRRAPFCFTAREFSVRCSSLRRTDGRTDASMAEIERRRRDYWIDPISEIDLRDAGRVLRFLCSGVN